MAATSRRPLLDAGTMTAMADDVSESTQPKKESAVVLTDPTVNMKNLNDFFYHGRSYL
mgnify:CR=1 FL=1